MQISVLAITIGNRNLVLIAAVLSVLKRDKKTDPGLLRSMPRDQRSSQEQLWGAACRRHFHEAKHQLR